MALCNPTPDFNSEEVSSVETAQADLNMAVQDMADHLPKEDPGKGLIEYWQRWSFTIINFSSNARIDLPWPRQEELDD